MRTIRVAPGIGDNIWILQKLINVPSGEKFIFHIPDSPPKRGKQIFDLLPQVAYSAQYMPGLPYRFLQRTNIQQFRKEFRNIRDRMFCLIANTHLEAGKRIEDFFPDLQTSFRIDWQTSQEDKANACTLLDGDNGHPLDAEYIGIYASAYSVQRNWGFWNEAGWLDLIRRVYERNKKAVFVIIGATWDGDLASMLMKGLDEEKIPFIDTIGNELGTVLEIMKRLKYFFAFPSGLGIVAPTVNCQVTMFYPPHLEKMINTWASPEDIASGLYRGVLFCTPKAAFEWAADNGKV